MTYLLLARKYWKLASLILLALLLAVQTVRLGAAKNEIERKQIDINELRGELQRISTKKNEQKAETGRNIKEGETKRREADRVAEKIEHAPLPENCGTPKGGEEFL